MKSGLIIGALILLVSFASCQSTVSGCLTNSTYCLNNAKCGFNGNCICPRFFTGMQCETAMEVTIQPAIKSETLPSGILFLICFLFFTVFPFLLYLVSDSECLMINSVLSVKWRLSQTRMTHGVKHVAKPSVAQRICAHALSEKKFMIIRDLRTTTLWLSEIKIRRKRKRRNRRK